MTKYYDDIKRICRKINPAGYEDLSHEVIIKMYENQEHIFVLEKAGNLISWVFTVARNKYINEVKITREKIDIDSCQIMQETIENPKKVVQDLILESELDHIETLWIEAFLSRDMMVTWLENDLKISRKCANSRLSYIIQKMKACSHLYLLHLQGFIFTSVQLSQL